MKKSKYIDYNILLACLSKKPQAKAQTTPPVPAPKDIVQEFYEALALPVASKAAGRVGWGQGENAEPVCCN
jgi:hypothetical protein